MPDYVYYDLLAHDLIAHDLPAPQAAMRDEVVAGLTRAPKQIRAKYFYDARGCELFDAICELPEYYPTRTELAIMAAHAPAMAAALGEDCTLIEIGCGNSAKSRLLIEALRPPVFVAVDIAGEQLRASCDALSQAFPRMRALALRADFEQALALPGAVPADGRRVLYFPGSTIGNFTPAAAGAFLQRWAPQLGRGGAALIGVDLKKDPARLNAAYNDAAGITACFNLNLLERFNRELKAGFDLSAFRHRAFYDEAAGRVEMHLESLRAQTVVIGNSEIGFAAGETIRTEISCKYSIAGFQQLAREAGYVTVDCWTDAEQLFAVFCLRLPD
jgi:dimethylhistidine N-methyltransferase